VTKDKSTRGKGTAGSPTLVINNLSKGQNITLAVSSIKKPPMSKLFG
jgi:transposase-like protein